MKVIILFALIAYIGEFCSLVSSDKGDSLDCTQMPVPCMCKGILQYMTMETSPIKSQKYHRVMCQTTDNPFHVCEGHGCSFYDSGLSVEPDLELTGNGLIMYPIGYVIPSVPRPAIDHSKGMDSDSGHHISGHGNHSHIPCYMKSLHNSHVFCWDYEYFISCNVTCDPGYVNIVHNHSVSSWNAYCKIRRDSWYPLQYKSCEPVGRNCKVNLRGLGFMKCVSGEQHYCDIGCQADEANPNGNVSLARYPCTANYADELPWCAYLSDEISDPEDEYYEPWDDYDYTLEYGDEE